MTDELIINKVNWLDERMEDLLCWFSCPELPNDQFYAPFFYAEVKPDGSVLFFCRVENNQGDEEGSPYCRLALGEKTAYDGKGQPIPDGVSVRLWVKKGLSEWSIGTLQAEDACWDNSKRELPICDFQVQEQAIVSQQSAKQEDKSICPHNKPYWKCKETECMEELARVEDDAYCPHGFLTGCPTCLEDESVIKEKPMQIVEPSNTELSELPETTLKYIESLETEIATKNSRIFVLLQEIERLSNRPSGEVQTIRLSVSSN